MSLFGSMFTGVSALNAQSQSMSMISNNIANVNTVGYKRDVASFSTLVTASGRTASYAPGGVRAITDKTVNQQGILQQTNSTTDVAISGNGFFAVQLDAENGTGTETFYTRAGSFSEDAQGQLRNSAGYLLMGWRLDDQGNLPAANADLSSLEPVDVAFLNGLTSPTSDVELNINLNASQDPTGAAPHFSRDITVYDSLGKPQTLRLEYTKNALNDWDINIFNGATNIATQNITFNGDGTLATPVPAANGKVELNLTGINWGNGSALQDIDIDISSQTQFAADYSVAFVKQNGAELGLRTGIRIDEDGYVISSFSNGQEKKLYKLAITTFTNPNGLEHLTGNVYRQTTDSGDYNLREAGKSGAGNITPSSLESSNVDLADEFSRMIVTQRAYSAGSKVVSTADQMLEELLRIR